MSYKNVLVNKSKFVNIQNLDNESLSDGDSYLQSESEIEQQPPSPRKKKRDRSKSKINKNGKVS